VKYAKLVKIGGQLIAAKNADYPDYVGFLVCPECGEPVFLRKAHIWRGKQREALFCHHQASDRTPECEARVRAYGSQDVFQRNAIARGQRLKMLTVSMWKYLRRSHFAIPVDGWQKWQKVGKGAPNYRALCNDCIRLLESQVVAEESLLEKGVAEGSLLKKGEAVIEMMTDLAGEGEAKAFLRRRERDWDLHVQISREALDLFCHSPVMRECRERMAYAMTGAIFMTHFSAGIDGSLTGLAVARALQKKEIVPKMFLELTVAVFLMVDWIEIFFENGK